MTNDHDFVYLPESQKLLEELGSAQATAQEIGTREAKLFRLLMQANRHVVTSNKIKVLCFYLGGISLGAMGGTFLLPFTLGGLGILVVAWLLRAKRDRAIQACVTSRINNLRDLGLINTCLSHHHTNDLERLSKALGQRLQNH